MRTSLRRNVGLPGAALIVAALIVLAGGPNTPPAAAAPPTRQDLQRQITDLRTHVDDLDSFVNDLLLPMTILVGLLAGGGVIGLLTSLRYERRQSQLHDLAMAGETSSQARADQTHVA